MKHYNRILIPVLMLLAASCAKEAQEFQESPAAKAVFFASVNDAESRLTMDNVGKISWNAGDEVGVWGGAWNNEVFTALNSGETTPLAVAVGELDPSADYYALSPYVEGASYEDDVYTLTLPDTQTLRADRLTLSPSVATTTGTEKSFVFRNACGLVSFTLTREDVSSVVIYSNNQEKISGTLTIDASDPESPAATLGTDGSNIVTLLPYSVSTFEPGTYYLALPPMTLSMGLTISLFKADGTLASKHRSSSFTVARNGWFDTGTVDGGTFSTEYKIKTAAQFQAFLSIAEQSWASDLTASLEADIDLDGVTLAEVSNFYGTLDGKGHSLKNWAATRPLVTYNNGTIKDLVIDASCSISAAGRTQTAFIARNNYGTISGCTNKASLTETVTIGASSYFGFITAINFGTVQSCVNEGSLDLTFNPDANTYFVYIGGLVGLHSDQEDSEGVHEPTAEFLLNDLDNKGTISYTTANQQRLFLGGVCGATYPSLAANAENKGELTSLVNEGNVVFTLASSISNYISISNVGGVIGYHEGTLKDCINQGKVTYDSPISSSKYYLQGPAVGGVAGSVTHGATGCKNQEDLDVKLTGMSTVAAGSTPTLVGTGATDMVAVGGVFGKVGLPTAGTGTFSGCENSGKLTVETSMNSSSTAARCEHFVGGVAGYVTLPASSCKNLSATGMNVKTKAYISNVGGVFGYSLCNVTDCDNDSSVGSDLVLTAKTGNQSMIGYASGIIGRAADGITIQQCDNTGAISVSNGHSESIACIGGVLAGPKTDVRRTAGFVTLTQSSNSGPISSTAPVLVRVGGVSAYQLGSYTINSNSGDVTVSNCLDGSAIGGVVGFVSVNGSYPLTNETQNADVTLSGSSVSHVGLLAGYNVVPVSYGAINNGSIKGILSANSEANIGLLYGASADRTNSQTLTVTTTVKTGTVIGGTTLTASNYNTEALLIGAPGAKTAFNTTNMTFE